MSGASLHWPDVRVEMAMDVLSCRITERERSETEECMLSIYRTFCCAISVLEIFTKTLVSHPLWIVSKSFVSCLNESCF